jgi:hypothetical protein
MAELADAAALKSARVGDSDRDAPTTPENFEKLVGAFCSL